MPKMHIEKSTVINAPVEKVYQVLSDFHQWGPWSPWLITEPEAQVSVAEDGKSYDWEGKRTGKGNMVIMDESANRSINMTLTFLKPWKSTAKVRFRLEPEGDGAKVTWFMDSSLPFFMFWMTKMMTGLIGMDYERGLNMLKEYIETGSVSSKLDFKGVSEFPGCQYVGIKTNTSIAAIGDAMTSDFGKLHTYFKENSDVKADLVFSIYHKWDPANQVVEYTSGCSVDTIPSNLPDGFITGEIPKTNVQTVSHIGPYQYLGNAWSALYAMKQAKEIKHKKKIMPFEVYVNDPTEVDEKELITDVNFAVR